MCAASCVRPEARCGPRPWFPGVPARSARIGERCAQRGSQSLSGVGSCPLSRENPSVRRVRLLPLLSPILFRLLLRIMPLKVFRLAAASGVPKRGMFHYY